MGSSVEDLGTHSAPASDPLPHHEPTQSGKKPRAASSVSGHVPQAACDTQGEVSHQAQSSLLCGNNCVHLQTAAACPLQLGLVWLLPPGPRACSWGSSSQPSATQPGALPLPTCIQES